jgi:hypothetical protein
VFIPFTPKRRVSIKPKKSPLVVRGGQVVANVLAIENNVRGFKPGRGRWIFNGDKNPQHAFLQMGNKAPRLNILRHVKEPFEV